MDAPAPLPKLPRARDWAALRADALPAAKQWLESARAASVAGFHASHDAQKSLRLWSDAIDKLLSWLLDAARDQAGGKPSPLAVVAVGGYGRRELFPFSDIDLWFLPGTAEDAGIEPIVQFICYILWDLGLEVGQAVRSEAETLTAAAKEHSVMTALLDARLVTGDRKLLTHCLKALDAQDGEEAVRAFTDAKLAERKRRHERHGNSRYLLEPNVKDGKGGLRDLHTLYWIARRAYRVKTVRELVGKGVLTASEARRFRSAFEFLSVIRMALHLAAGKAEERLTFDLQRRLAEELGFRESEANRSVERFMKRYFQVAGDVGSLTRLICSALDEHQRRTPKRFWAMWRPRGNRTSALKVEGGRLMFSSPELLDQQPLLMLELFRQAQADALDIHPYALQEVSRRLKLIDRSFQRNPEANAIFLSILLSDINPEETLRQMRETGLLGKFLPDFGRVVGQMQFDMFHIYTVDEHILRALSILHRLERGEFKVSMPIASDIVSQVQSRRVLYLALFCHDVAKGRGGDHAAIGSSIARALAGRFGYSAAETEATEWLVEHHQLFSDTAHKRDLSDPATVKQFVAQVQSLERLRLLLVLTVVDMQAVGPHIWNGWKALLLRELYRRAEAMIRTGAPLQDDPAQVAEQIAAILPKDFAPLIARYVDEVNPVFLSGSSPEEHMLIICLLERTWAEGVPSAHLQSHLFHDISHITLVAPDRPGLLADATGTMARAGLTVVGARITTLKSGVAVQLWQVQDLGQHAVTDKARAEVLQESLAEALGPTPPAPAPLSPRLFTQSLEAFETPIEIFLENRYSETFTILEVSAPDRVGLLHTLARAISDEGLTIASAHIGTYGEKAVDVFYVKDRWGMKIEHPGRIEEVKGRLSTALAGA